MRPFLLALLALLVSRPCLALPPHSAVEIAELVKQLGSDSFQERRSAEQKLEAFGELAYPALERAANGAGNEEVRRSAKRLAALVEQRFTFPGAMAYLRDASWGNKPVESARVEQAFALMLRNEDRQLLQEAFGLITDLSQKHSRFSALLVGATKDERPAVRHHALFSLGKLRPPTKDAMAALLRAYRDNDQRVADTARGAVIHVVNGAIEDLRERDPRTRAAAASVLGGLGGILAKAPPALIEALEDKDPQVRESARKAVKRLDDGAKQSGVK